MARERNIWTKTWELFTLTNPRADDEYNKEPGMTDLLQPFTTVIFRVGTGEGDVGFVEQSPPLPTPMPQFPALLVKSCLVNQRIFLGFQHPNPKGRPGGISDFSSPSYE